MKRSGINNAIRTAEVVLEKYNICLPFFARMSPDDWKKAGPEYDGIVMNRLGWDISDFGANDFDSFGTVQFTLRNGRPDSKKAGTPYAEKYIILKPGQRLPLHFHFSKTEDIINRAGGILVMELYNSLKDHSVDQIRDVAVCLDGLRKTVRCGEPLQILPGNSITLTPMMYHRFRAGSNGGILICGEVSTINDDEKDNFFAEPVRRFAEIEEDEKPLRLLCSEYRSYGGR